MKRQKYLVLGLYNPDGYNQGERNCVVPLSLNACKALKDCITQATQIFEKNEALAEMSFDYEKWGGILQVVVMPASEWDALVSMRPFGPDATIAGIESLANKDLWVREDGRVMDYTWNGVDNIGDLESGFWPKCDDISGGGYLHISRKRMRLSMYTENFGLSDTTPYSHEALLKFIEREFPDL